MIQPQASGSVQPPPFAAIFRAVVVPMICTAPVIVLVFWLTRGVRGGLAAVLGVSVAVAFFASGLYVMKRVTTANPLSVLAGALAVYLGQVIFLGLVILTLSGADWLDGQAFGLSVLAVALIWQVFQVVAFVRLRQPIYDARPDEPADEPVDAKVGQSVDESVLEPTAEPVDESDREPSA